jgi:hypothetical protein
LTRFAAFINSDTGSHEKHPRAYVHVIAADLFSTARASLIFNENGLINLKKVGI